MKITVIIPYSNQDASRIDALNKTLDCIDKQDLRLVINGQATIFKNYDFIFVEQKTHDNYQWVDTRGIPDVHVKLEHFGRFNKSWCMNVGAKLAGPGYLVYIDADMLFGKEYLSYCFLWANKQEPVNPKFFIGWSWITKLPGRDEPIARIIRPSIMTAGGIFWILKEFYWSIGGMNENYFGYGGEDNDFWIRANCTLGSKNVNNVKDCPYPLVHTYHDNAVPSKERFVHLDRTVQYPDAVIKKLKMQELGNCKNPTVVDFDDLVLIDPTIDSKEGKGIVTN